MPRAHSRRWAAAVIVVALLAVALAVLSTNTPTPSAEQASRATPEVAPAGAVPEPAPVPGTPPGTDFRPAAYTGPPYPEAADLLDASHRPRTRLWYHDRAWWGLLVGPDTLALRIHELMPDHTWRPTNTVMSSEPAVGDALPAGNRLYVLLAGDDEVLRVARLTYDAASRQYAMDEGFPEVVAALAAPRARIALDAAGHLWATWAERGRVWVTRSGDEGREWSSPVSPTAETLSDASNEMAVVAAFGDAIGVLWSNQDSHVFSFAVHREGDPLDKWTMETALTGEGMVDDHIHLSVMPGDSGETLIAAVKTSLNDLEAPSDSPLTLVLVRSPDGTWSSHTVSRIKDRVTRPITVVDPANQRVHLFQQAPNTGGAIYHKASRLPDLSFDAGPGEVWISGTDAALADPSSARQPVTAATGLVVLASEVTGNHYWHGEQALALPQGGLPDIPDDMPPASPGQLSGSRSDDVVELAWSPAWDDDHWAPAADQPPVAGYVVSRDGTEIGTTAQQRFIDSFPEDDVDHRYGVAAVDMAGNLSEPVTLVLPAPKGLLAGSTGWWLAASAVGAAGIASAALLTNRRRQPRPSRPIDVRTSA